MSNIARADPEEIDPLFEGTPEQMELPHTQQRLDQEQQWQQKGPGSESKKPSPPLGIAFSGGGIRSAAFCSGVLRWMLKKNAPMEYLSCVSGGGYTGAAFLDWAYRHRDSSNEWHNKFFEKMHQNAGYLCNWQTPCKAIGEAILFCCLVFITVFLLPCLLWFPYALPVAEAVDFLLGDILRESSNCGEPAAQPTLDLKRSKSSYLLMELYGHCSPSSKRVMLFTLTVVFSLVFYFLSRCKWHRFFQTYKGHLRLGSTLLGLFFFFTAAPWIAHDFLWPLQAWVQVVVFFICLVLPFFFPIIRNYAGIFLFFYAYTYIISWKVFKIQLFGKVSYSDAVFYPVLVACCGVIVFFPFLGAVHRSLFNAYYRWRPSKAFFKVPASCKWMDVFPCCGVLYEGVTDQYRLLKGGTPRSSQDLNGDKEELTLDDLKDLRHVPKFISNITVNDWQIDSRNGPSHHLLAFSTEDVNVVGKYVDENGESIDPPSFCEKHDSNHGQSRACRGFTPGHMRLSHAMAISGAAMSFDMGSYESGLDMVLDLLSLLGLGFGAEMASDQVYHERNKEKPIKSCKKVVTSILLEVFVSFPLITMLFCYFLGSKTNVITGLVLCHIAILVLLSCIAVLNTGSFPQEKSKCCSCCSRPGVVRWLIPKLFFVRFLRGFLNIPHVYTHMPPPVLRLSDGGHFENLALLPLLEKRLKYIVIADGSCNAGGAHYADALLLAIKTAREKLHCSFTPFTEKEKMAENDERRDTEQDMGVEDEEDKIRDIEEDIRVHFLTKKNGRLPRHYRFKVHYHYTEEGRDKCSTGEILFLAPRHPSECKPVTDEPKARSSGEQGEVDKKWKYFDVELGDLKEEYPDKLWTKSPRELTEDQANRLTWCCCQRLHGYIKEPQETRDKASRLTCRCQCHRGCCPCCTIRCTSDCCPGKICHRISSFLLGGFPHHITANQFFTPDMFSAYHREGLAACIEAGDEAKAFFKELTQNEETSADESL